jgi:hypothetical protein
MSYCFDKTAVADFRALLVARLFDGQGVAVAIVADGAGESSGGTPCHGGLLLLALLSVRKSCNISDK